MNLLLGKPYNAFAGQCLSSFRQRARISIFPKFRKGKQYVNIISDKWVGKGVRWRHQVFCFLHLIYLSEKLAEQTTLHTLSNFVNIFLFIKFQL